MCSLVWATRHKMKAKSRNSLRRSTGQAIVEFVVVMGILLATLAMVALFLEVQREHGDRVLRLVASEYP